MFSQRFQIRKMYRDLNAPLPFDHMVTLRNWLPINLLDFNSKLSKIYNMEVYDDFRSDRDFDFKSCWKDKSITRWCILSNHKAVGINGKNKIVVKNLMPLWKKITLTILNYIKGVYDGRKN